MATVSDLEERTGVLIADDQLLFRRALARLLHDQPGVRVVAEAVDGQDAVEKCAACRPDVILMDVRMPTLDGLHATERILDADPEARVIMLTTFENDHYVLDALRIGARGYILKDAEPEALVLSIRTVHAGQRVLGAVVADALLHAVGGGEPSLQHGGDGLTARETEIIGLIALGLPNKQIAYRLHVGPKTVRKTISSAYEKLGISDRSEAVLYAVRVGLVEL